MSKIKITINNREVEAYEGQTVLEAAKNNGIHIPTLCYLKDVTGTGACRVCQVELEGAKTLCAACVYPVRDGMVIKTNSQRALDARRRVVELIVSNHSKDCLSCIRNTNCELQRLCQELGVREDAFAGEKSEPTFDTVSPGIVRNTSKCVLCGRCVETCTKVQGLGVLGYMNRGFKTKVAPIYDKSFDKVYDTNFGADLTIMEEGYEFLNRLQNQGTLPMITSCSPGWVNYVEHEYPDLLDHLSTCKSPHMMLGAMVKSVYAEAKGIDPRDIYVVSIMPCVAKKGEKQRAENKTSPYQDVDAVLTTRELAKLIKMFGINFRDLKDDDFDQDLFGEYSGAGVIFGASGGVMEAALRTVADILAHEDLSMIDYHAVRGVEGVKESTIKIGEQTLKVAVAQSMALAKPLLDDMRNGVSPYHFIEIMGCPGGCINGGGQPYVNATIRNSGFNFKQARAKALYDEDISLPVRKSHKNSQIQNLYKNYLGEPNSEKAHHLLHTHYTKKARFK